MTENQVKNYFKYDLEMEPRHCIKALAKAITNMAKEIDAIVKTSLIFDTVNVAAPMFAPATLVISSKKAPLLFDIFIFLIFIIIFFRLVYYYLQT